MAFAIANVTPALLGAEGGKPEAFEEGIGTGVGVGADELVDTVDVGPEFKVVAPLGPGTDAAGVP